MDNGAGSHHKNNASGCARRIISENRLLLMNKDHHMQ
jgi:hypothetical protein